MRAPRRLRTALVLAACVAAGTGATFSGAPEPAVVLVSTDASVGQAPGGAADPSVLRSRQVAIDFSVLPDATRTEGQAAAPHMRLDLFPDVVIDVVVETSERHSNGVTLSGRVEGSPMSQVTLAYGGGLLAASIVTSQGTYAIRPLPMDERAPGAAVADGLHVVSQVNPDARRPEAPPIEVEIPDRDLIEAEGAVPTDTADVIDLLVLYTRNAFNDAGGAAGIANLINLGVSETNTANGSSGVSHRFRVVHAAEVDYAESNSFSTNLSVVRAGIGSFSGVPDLRNAYGGDLVMLFVRPAQPDFCGIAFLMTNVSTAFAPSGYSVVDTRCVAGFTVAHEIGHNMGLRHDWYMDAGVSPFSDAHGYVNPSPGQRWRTIMSYPDHCSSQGFSCSRLLRWSNPEHRYEIDCGRGFNCAQLRYWYFPGTPLGVFAGTNTSCRPGNAQNPKCDADERRVLNATAFSVANFRQATQGDGSRLRWRDPSP